MVKSYENLVHSDTKVDVNTGMIAASRLQALIASRDNSTDVLQMRVELGRIIEAVRSTVPQEMWGEIAGKLDRPEHPEPLDVEADAIDDADDAYDPTEFIDEDDDF